MPLWALFLFIDTTAKTRVIIPTSDSKKKNRVFKRYPLKDVLSKLKSFTYRYPPSSMTNIKRKKYSSFIAIVFGEF